MKQITLFTFIALALVFFAACGSPAPNTPANTSNANTAKPKAAAPTADALLAQDKPAWEAFIKSDGKFFDGFLSDKFVGYDEGHRSDKAAIVKMISGGKCDVKDGWKLEDPQMATIDADTYVLTYKATVDGTCPGPDGKPMKIPSPVRGGSVFVRSGDKWLGVFHGENPILDPKNPPPAADKKPVAKDAKKEEPKKDDKAAANVTTADAKLPGAAADANTDALVKIHTSGWEAFKAKNAKKFEEITTKDLSFIDPFGGWASGQANVIKLWTETMKCEGITNVKVSEGVATALSPTVEILTLKGTSDGTCDGQKNGDVYQTAFYVKDADAWKLAFMFESVGM